MSNKIDVPRELLEVIANSSECTFAEINDAIQQARAILAANPEENTPCPQCGGSLKTWGCNCIPRWPMHKSTSEKCTVPPTGWTCSRRAGHFGPCAATPTTAG